VIAEHAPHAEPGPQAVGKPPQQRQGGAVVAFVVDKIATDEDQIGRISREAIVQRCPGRHPPAVDVDVAHMHDPQAAHAGGRPGISTAYRSHRIRPIDPSCNHGPRPASGGSGNVTAGGSIGGG
jgi:hypothetical protein